MKTLALALSIPLAICTACSNKEASVATTATSTSAEPAPSAAAPEASVALPAPAPANAATSAAGAAPATAPAPVHVTLVPASGSNVGGMLTVTNEGDAVSILGEITGLGPGKEYGFHVHEVGQCSLPDFTSAGEHFNPTMDPHGGPKSKARHLGDLPNARADKNGRALIDVTVRGPNLVDKDGAPTEILGRALVVHAMPDDYKTQPSGGSGARIACGVIR